MPIELQKFRKQLIYQETAPISVIKTDLDDLAALDQLAELKQNKYGKKALYYFLGVLSFSILMIMLSTLSPGIGFLSVVIILLLLGCVGLMGGWIYALVMMFKFKKLNISNNRYDVSKKILEMLARDVNETALISIKLDFNKGEIKENKTGTIPHPYKSGWKIDIYQNEWLKIQGSFLDNSQFLLTTTELLKKQYGWKRGSSGKSKYKSKTKSIGLEASLSLTYPLRRYGAVKILKNDVINAVKLPPSSTLKRLRVTDKVMYLGVRIEPQFAESQDKVYQTIASMFLSIYQVLNLAKTLSK
ncbi:MULTISPECIES: hypothetical protein [unclassified Anabaena]|uniref:hypothetical protein n=1 Tax=unclassified Anabaena TaxID=2619674 RepID=UPI002B20D57E|nr:hypothetical protein [Anabaena sp. UHCC 0399]MEA5568260.1 hypothetical protein [Anabaena sp. UHCC 0399]